MVLGLPAILGGRRGVFALANLWGAVSVWLLEAICGLKLEYRGIENIPTGAVLIASKHQSFLETFALLKYAPDFAIILKRQLTYIPLFGLYLIVSSRSRSTGPRAGRRFSRSSTPQAGLRRRSAGVHLSRGNPAPARSAAALQKGRRGDLRRNGVALPPGGAQHRAFLASARVPAPTGRGGDRISARPYRPGLTAPPFADRLRIDDRDRLRPAQRGSGRERSVAGGGDRGWREHGF